MEKLDLDVLEDIRKQIDYCTCLSLKYVSIIATDRHKISSLECHEILRRLLCSFIMEGNPQRVLSFLSVPIRFVIIDETSDMLMEEIRKELESMILDWKDRLLYSILQ